MANKYGKKHPGSGTVNPYPGMFGSDKREAHEQQEQKEWEDAGLIPSSDPDAGESPGYITPTCTDCAGRPYGGQA